MEVQVISSMQFLAAFTLDFAQIAGSRSLNLEEYYPMFLDIAFVTGFYLAFIAIRYAA